MHFNLGITRRRGHFDAAVHFNFGERTAVSTGVMAHPKRTERCEENWMWKLLLNCHFRDNTKLMIG
jgi:hypothetical protein